MLPRLALLALAVLCAPVSAQIPTDWAPREDANAALPLSIRVFETTTPGASAWYVRADPSDSAWRLAAELSPSGTETVASFAARAGALVAVNGGYFGGSQSFSLVLDDGQASASNIAALTRSGQTYYPTRGAFGLSPGLQPDVAWIYDVGGVQTAYDVPNANREGETPEPQPTASFPAGARPWTMQTAIGGGPVLVEGGQVRLTWEEEVFFGGSGVDTTSARARTAAGYDAEGHLLLFAAAESPGLTLRQLATVMVSLGAVEAVNLDGGGSTALLAGGQTLRGSARPVASALLLVPTGPEDPILLDTGDDGYREEGAWFESGNTPYYGSTPARLLEVGEEGRAVFEWDELLGPSAYRVEAWWVPSGNRAVDTPFTLHTGAGAQVFRADQSDPATAGRWNVLGEAEVAPGDSLVVTADATAGAGTTYVCVDAVRLVPMFPPDAVEDVPADALGLRLAPNPARDRLVASLALVTPGEVQLVLVDALGRAVRHETARLGEGRARVDVDVRGLAAGVYTLRATTPDGTAARRVTVVR